MGSEASARRYTFVTVCFERDIGLLQLQARSMRMFCPADLIGEIIIVDNSTLASVGWQDKVLHQYGDLARFVRVLSAGQIVELPPGTDGWYTQQILKVKVAAFVRTDRFVLLDSKDHLVRNIDRQFLETASGNPRTNGYSYADQPMREFLERTLIYLGLDVSMHVKWFTRTTTPFIMLRDEATKMVEYIERRESKAFANVFLEKGLSEFFLYSGYLALQQKLFEVYDITQPNGPTVWVDNADEAGCRDIIGKVERSRSPFMAVHRKAIAKMKSSGRKVIAEYWHELNMFPTMKDGVRFLQDPNGSHQEADGRVHPLPISRILMRFAARLGGIRRRLQ